MARKRTDTPIRLCSGSYLRREAVGPRPSGGRRDGHSEIIPQSSMIPFGPPSVLPRPPERSHASIQFARTRHRARAHALGIEGKVINRKYKQRGIEFIKS